MAADNVALIDGVITLGFPLMYTLLAPSAPLPLFKLFVVFALLAP